MGKFEYFSLDKTIRPLRKYVLPGLRLAAFGLLVMFIGLSFFAWPSADDFCIAATFRKLGIFDILSLSYFGSSGRYATVFTMSLLGGYDNIVAVYPYAAIVVLVSTWLSFSFLAWTISRHVCPFRFPFLTGAIATILFIAGVPDPAQTFYWLAGSFTYQIGNVFSILFIALCIRRETASDDQSLRALILLLSAGLTVAAIGSNEVSMILTVMLIACGTWYSVRERRQSRLFWLTLLLIGIVFTFISVLAPGNFQRFSTIDGDSMIRPTPWMAVLLYIPWVMLRILYWLSNPGLWASAFVMLIFTAETAQNILYKEGMFRRSFLAVPVFWICGIFVLNAIGFLINRYPLPERAESVVFLFFLLGWYPSFLILGNFLAADNISNHGKRLMLAAMMLLLVSMLGAPNVFEGYKDTYRGYRYTKEMQARFAQIDAAMKRGDKEITLASISRPPRTLFATDITSDPKNFRNACLGSYYGFDTVRLGTPSSCANGEK
ncbi:MAG TPA: DUF6056 family protein [Smithella sp.]|nr:DUF6056 family protein [Smithella sp.]HNY50493.1 DUF6056 family protein [Smithella sp.]HOG90179.1 DUF6056 family protein [Smithella sp.]HOU50765.1 DUF6056 family protein [Smithella sp.]HQI71951.1 DUF6056 family protein [Smithella sp.]